MYKVYKVNKAQSLCIHYQSFFSNHTGSHRCSATVTPTSIVCVHIQARYVRARSNLASTIAAQQKDRVHTPTRAAREHWLVPSLWFNPGHGRFYGVSVPPRDSAHCPYRSMRTPCGIPPKRESVYYRPCTVIAAFMECRAIP